MLAAHSLTADLPLLTKDVSIREHLDQKELEHGMFAVLRSADEWDDQLQKEFGGKRWSDA